MGIVKEAKLQFQAANKRSYFESLGISVAVTLEAIPKNGTIRASTTH